MECTYSGGGPVRIIISNLSTDIRVLGASPFLALKACPPFENFFALAVTATCAARVQEYFPNKYDIFSGTFQGH
jgi:hypothetical protein